MRPDDFFTDEPGVWGPRQVVDMVLLQALRQRPLGDHSDVEVAPELTTLIHEELRRFGTGGTPLMSDADIRIALQALHATVSRIGVPPANVPFRDFSTFKEYWNRQGAAGNGGYQKRRNILSAIFDGLHDTLAELETRSLSSTLAEPVTSHPRTGWPKVDVEITLRRHFQNAVTEQDCRAVGNDCVHVLEAVSAAAYDPAVHLWAGETEPPVQCTKDRLERAVEVDLVGSDNARMRALVRATIEVAQQVKHSGTRPGRRPASPPTRRSCSRT